MLAAAALFTAIAIYGSLVPLAYRALDWREALERFRQIPYLSIGVGGRADWVSNILLFLPLGYFWLGAASLGRSRGARMGWAISLVALLAALSVAIEFTQLWFPPRTVSQNDIIAETIGAMLGAVIWLLSGEAAVTWAQRYAAPRRPAGQIEWLLQAYLAGFVLYSVMPLDLTINLKELALKLREGKIQIVPFAYSYESAWSAAVDLGRDVLVCLPIGALAALIWRRPNAAARSFTTACLIGVGVLAAIELAQVFVYSRVASTTDVLVEGLGVAVGAGLVRYFVGRSQVASSATSGQGAAGSLGVWSLVGLAYAAAILAAAWMPFDLTRDPDVIRERLHTLVERVPGASLYAGSEFNAMSQVLSRLLTYAPLGAIACLWASALARSVAGRRVAMLLGLGFIAAVSLASELGQVFVVTRIPDVTEVPICMLGAILGMAITSRLQAAARLTATSRAGGGKTNRAARRS